MPEEWPQNANNSLQLNNLRAIPFCYEDFVRKQNKEFWRWGSIKFLAFSKWVSRGIKKSARMFRRGNMRAVRVVLDRVAKAEL